MKAKWFNYFTLTEKLLWLFSVAVIIGVFIAFDRTNYLSFSASLIGVTALIFCAKGNPFGQVLMIIFGLMYGVISFMFRYYGEVITYLGMSVPMAVISLISWLKNPYKGNKAQVTVNKISLKEVPVLLILTAAVTTGFYFILRYFNTANLIFSTISIATSFSAVYLSFRRSPYFALAYVVNDVVLIILWVLATIQDISYISVIICFSVFLINDVYGFISWRRMRRTQSN